MSHSVASNHLHSARAREELNNFSSIGSQLRRTWQTNLFGFIGFIAGVFIVIWNEGRAVQRAKALEEAIQSVTPISALGPIDSANYGKLVYLTGVIIVQEPLTEVDYGVSVSAVKLKRRVQMYQWHEEEIPTYDADGQQVDINYYYFTEWKDKIIDSSQFENSLVHWNPKKFPVNSQTQINENVKIGQYHLGSELKEKFADFIEITSDERPERKDIKLHSGLYYHSHDVWNPEVGDIRLQFSYAGPNGQLVSVVAMLDDTNTLVPYKTSNGQTLLILSQAFYTLEEAFTFEHTQNNIMTWLFRCGAWFFLYFSCVALSNILRSLVIRSRFLREVLPTQNSSLKMAVSMSTSLFMTAAAWMWYRPLLGSSLILVTISFILVTKYLSGGTQAQGYRRL